MFTDRTSFLLTISVSLGFSIAGILDILDNYVVIALIVIGFLLVVANLFSGGKPPVKVYKKEDSTNENVDTF